MLNICYLYRTTPRRSRSLFSVSIARTLEIKRKTEARTARTAAVAATAAAAAAAAAESAAAESVAESGSEPVSESVAKSVSECDPAPGGDVRQSVEEEGRSDDDFVSSGQNKRRNRTVSYTHLTLPTKA